MSYYKWKIKTFYKNCDLTTSSRPFCVCKELSTTSIGKWKFWSNLLTLDMQGHIYLLLFISRPHFSQNSLIKIFLLSYYIKWPNFMTRLYLRYELTQFNMCHVSCIDIWWHHDIWISEKLKLSNYRSLKFDYQSEIKNIFLVSQVLFFRLIKQASKNKAGTTFKLC